ncbi:hypothetical protein NL676_016116 [Syzygium grande]|nr:hypothetical protein NL676_016116 [Syzygium grande]
MLNTGIFSRDKFPDVWLEVRTNSEFHAQLSSSPNGKGTLMLPHVRTQLSSVKVAQGQGHWKKTQHSLCHLYVSPICASSGLSSHRFL